MSDLLDQDFLKAAGVETEEPLLYTAYGNVPMADCQLEVTWEDHIVLSAKLITHEDIEVIDEITGDRSVVPRPLENPMVQVDKDGFMTMIESWYDKETSECVKRSVHQHQFKGHSSDSQLGSTG